MRYQYFMLIVLQTIATYGLAIDYQLHTISDKEKNIILQLNLHPTEQILKQTLSVSLDNPHATCGTVNIQPAAVQQYLPEFSDSKEILINDTTLVVPILLDSNQPLQANLHVSFLLMPSNIITEKIIPVAFNQSTSNTESTQTATPSRSHAYTQTEHQTSKSFTQKLQKLVETTDQLWIRLLFAFLLGLLLSLTPCIYPMIPITIGILNARAQTSVLKNFLGSCCYALGMATTFACLGLLAAFAGASFGSLLSKPIFVIILVLFIGYMSLTMIGIIDLKIPSFLQRSVSVNSAFGPYIAAYFFGLISGSVASPCVSPGLALLLTIVATMGSVVTGFILLFCFGIGLSTPLVIIGTFSSSMQILPQAGMWMVEIKKILGFVMLATCLYYLNNILPHNIMMIILIAYLLFASIFYIIDAQKDFDTKTKTLKSFIGIVLLGISVFLIFKTYERRHHKPQETIQHGVAWTTNYERALEEAQLENKMVLLDFWANHCTICKAIEKKIFDKDVIHDALKNKLIFVKVDCTDNSNSQTNMLKNKFKVFAQPAILIINPTDETIMKRWSSEPYNMTPEEFIQAAKA